MCDLRDEKLEEARDLFTVAPDRRRQRRRVDVGRLERAHVELQPVAELLDAAEHAHRVALGEAAVEQLDVVPDARLDAAGRVDELEREVRTHPTSSAACASRARRRRPRRPGPRRAPRSSRLQSRCGVQIRKPSASRPVATLSSTSAASRRRQPNGPARSAAVSSPACASTSRASSRRASSRCRQPFREAPLPGEQVVRDRAPRAGLLDQVPVRQHELAVQRGDEPVDVLLRQPGQVAQLRPGQCALRR